MPPAVIVVDDVYTTGATLFAATDAVRVAGATIVRCLTFARVGVAPRPESHKHLGAGSADPARFATLGNGRKAGK